MIPSGLFSGPVQIEYQEQGPKLQVGVYVNQFGFLAEEPAKPNFSKFQFLISLTTNILIQKNNNYHSFYGTNNLKQKQFFLYFSTFRSLRPFIFKTSFILFVFILRMSNYSARTILNMDHYPNYLGIILRHYCPSFLPNFNSKGIHEFLTWKYCFVDFGNHHCLFWPCWLFFLCPTTGTVSKPISCDNHWHCVYADCPKFIHHVHTPPFYTNLVRGTYPQ